MTAIELKKALVRKIAEIDDMSFLNAIKTILDSKTQSKTMVLDAEQRYEIEESRKEINLGLVIDQNTLDKEFDKWLSAK